MNQSIAGIHHVTAITSDAQKNVDFYVGVLGLKLVKLTVNFDDPASYHLYYGDASGSPGSLLTFFAWPGAGPGRIGAPQVTVTAFSVPKAALNYWSGRLGDSGVAAGETQERFGQMVLSLADPDGMKLELIEADDNRSPVYENGVDPKFALRGFHGVTIAEEGYEKTAELLTGTMGFRSVSEDRNRFRYEAAGGGPGALVDLLCVPDGRHGTMGAGAVHHIALRTPDDQSQMQWLEILRTARLNSSPVMDRTYFHSIYFREPGGVLFEIATDTPGMTVDQPLAELGAKLMLPPWLEKHRDQLLRVLPPVKLPGKKGSP